MKNLLKTVSFVSFVSFFILACGKEVDSDGNALVRFRLELNSTGRDQILNSGYTYKLFKSPRLSGEMLGINGLLVFSYGIIEGDIPSLIAFDLCCPYENRVDVRVVPNENFKATCENCGSVYDFANQGIRESGPTTRGLLTYRKVKAVFPYTGYFNIKN